MLKRGMTIRYYGSLQRGSQPAVLVWDCTNQMLLAELKGHRFGVSCVDFSPGGGLFFIFCKQAFIIVCIQFMFGT